MRAIILTTLLTAITATAAPVYNINTGREVSGWNRVPYRANVLPQTREGAAQGWREVVPFVAPEGMVVKAGTRSINVASNEAHEVYQVWTAEEAAAYAAAVQQATLVAIAAQAGDKITQLEGIIDWFGLTRPVTQESAIAGILAWQAQQTDLATIVQGNTKSQLLMALFTGLEKAGIDESTVSAVWQYMQAQEEPTE